LEENIRMRFSTLLRFFPFSEKRRNRDVTRGWSGDLLSPPFFGEAGSRVSPGAAFPPFSPRELQDRLLHLGGSPRETDCRSESKCRSSPLLPPLPPPPPLPESRALHSVKQGRQKETIPPLSLFFSPPPSALGKPDKRARGIRNCHRPASSFSGFFRSIGAMMRRRSC